MTLDLERQRFQQYLRRRGLRMTAERRAVLEEIYRQHGHIDADALLRTIRDRGRKVSRATVYRNLELLVECGLVRKQRFARRRILYEHVHPGQRHDHLVCRGCGRVVEFVSPGLEVMLQEICRAHGFALEGAALQVSTPHCRECADEADGELSARTGSG